jgi:hypothetical protein
MNIFFYYLWIIFTKYIIDHISQFQADKNFGSEKLK